MSEPRVLVTGGAGFVGSHLCERLLCLGHEVLCIDDFSTGAHENLAHLRHHPRLRIATHDVTSPLSADVDEIYNLACPASPVQYQKNPIQTTKTSVLGALNVLELARRQGARIFQASTSEVYGDPNSHPQAEAYWGHVNPIGVRSCYDEGKRCAETLFFDYHRLHGVPVRVARIFNTFGPRMRPDDGRVVSNFIVQALRGKPLTVFGNGLQTRSFCYVDDLVDGILAMMAAAPPITGPVNLGNPAECSMIDLAKIILRLTGSHSRLTFEPLPADDPKQRQPDISLARSALDWEPKVTLEAGLLETIAYFDEHLMLGRFSRQAARGGP
ncbi:MAG TPA: UDP-glucuronic acid decarboxylase family protein [Caulobacter sp.]|nr:UDP-glucuronic acid decarboxylase family protein [Caulobacter sp.]